MIVLVYRSVVVVLRMFCGQLQHIQVHGEDSQHANFLMLEHLLDDREQKVHLQHHKHGIWVCVGRPASRVVMTEHIAHKNAAKHAFYNKVDVSPQRPFALRLYELFPEQRRVAKQCAVQR